MEHLDMLVLSINTHNHTIPNNPTWYPHHTYNPLFTCQTTQARELPNRYLQSHKFRERS